MSAGPRMAVLREADEAASVAHDYIWPQQKGAVTKEEASDAIWRIHDILRPLIEAEAHTGLDGETLSQAITAVLGYFCSDENMARVAAEYARLAAPPPGDGPEEIDVDATPVGRGEGLLASGRRSRRAGRERHYPGHPAPVQRP